MANDFVTRNGFISLDNSQITGSLFNTRGGVTGSLFGTSSWAPTTISSSIAISTATSSLGLTASSADNFNVTRTTNATRLLVTQNAILSGSVESIGGVSFSYLSGGTPIRTFFYSPTTGQITATGSLFGTASFASTSSLVISASFARTASFITSQSFAPTASSVNILSQSLNISGSLGVFVGSSSRLRVESTGVTFGNTITDSTIVTGSLITTGSLQVTGSVGFSYLAVGAGPLAWSTGGALIIARTCLGGAGTQNEALAMGGKSGPGNVQQTATEEYNGTSWATGGNMISGRWLVAGAGTQNVGLVTGWVFSGNTEEYNGTSWAGGGNLITTRDALAAAGTQNEGLAFGGGAPSSATISCTEEYNGTSWSAGGALITRRRRLAGAGTQNVGLSFGGNATYVSLSCTEEYNGTTWASGGAMIQALEILGGAGTQNSALSFGGATASGTTQTYDGTSWSSNNSLITGRAGLAGAGSSANLALAFGGQTPACVSCTEEFSPSDTFLISFQHRSTDGMLLLSRVSSSLDYASDAAASTGGVPLGGLYRSGSVIRIRLT